jgi:3-hydroxyacyl-CoA dehydrogenase/enoyl-CoA hydratase/3-hydroxybutyryl-CoA epimerase
MPTLAALAVALQSLAYRTSGPASVLHELASITTGTDGARLQNQANAAQQHLGRGHITEPEFFDVAACTAGVFPAWSGGPFTWASQHSESLAA